MKKKKNNKVPACAFGIDQILNSSAGLTNILGNSLQAIDPTNKVNVAGSALSGIGTGATAGMALGPIGAAAGGLIGGITGLFTAGSRNRAIRKEKKRKESIDFSNIADANSQMLAEDYYGENDLAYTFAKGGIMPNSLAYVDNGEMIQTPDGNINEVTAGSEHITDNVLANLPEGTGILSDKLKVPGTNKTFAEMGKKLEKRTKPSKGTDIYAKNADSLNKMNANFEFDDLLKKQKEVQEKKGIKQKMKNLPAYNKGILSTPAPINYTSILNDKITPYSSTVTNGKTPNTISAGFDWLGGIGSLAPVMYNMIQGSKSPEVEQAINNPYTGNINRTMARRRYNVSPLNEAIIRNRNIAGYNASQANTNTGASMAMRTNLAAQTDSALANAWNTKQNADNQYAGDYANTLNSLGQQAVQARSRVNEINARNRAMPRNYAASAASQFGQWAQTQQQMRNQMNRDAMTMPFLSNLLSQGYTSDMINNLYNQYNKR